VRVRRLAGALALAGSALALVVGLAVRAQQPAERPAPSAGAVTVDCNTYAEAAFRIARLRTVDARLDLVIEQLRRDLPDAPAALVDAIAREARLVYRERHAPDEARFQAYLRCQAVLGVFGADT